MLHYRSAVCICRKLDIRESSPADGKVSSSLLNRVNWISGVHQFLDMIQIGVLGLALWKLISFYRPNCTTEWNKVSLHGTELAYVLNILPHSKKLTNLFTFWRPHLVFTAMFVSACPSFW